MLEALITLLEIAANIAKGILERLNKIAEDKEKDRSTQVIAYANALLDESRRYKNITAVAVLIANGNFEITGDDVKFLDAVLIGDSGYNVYIINQGKIVNNGDRGFINWTVVGNSKQDNNVITIPG